MSDTLQRCEHDGVKWFPRVTVEKYSPDQSAWAERKLHEELSWGRRLLVAKLGVRVPRLHGDWLRDVLGEPEDGYAHAQGNLLVAGGLLSIWGYLVFGTTSGASGQVLSNTRTGTGTGATATAATVADIHLGADAGSAYYQQMDATYPSNPGAGTANGGQLSGQATYASGNGNYNWVEWCWFTTTAAITAGATLSGVGTNALMLNHWTGTSLGTKGSGATWVFSTTITLSLCQVPEPSFGFGPAWARGSGCCAKPAGCTNMSGQCLMRGHPWKRQVLTIDGPERAQEGTMAAFRDKQGEDPAEVTLASQEAVYVFAGRLEDGTKVVRGSDGVLHALAAVKRSCDGQAKPGWAAKPE